MIFNGYVPLRRGLLVHIHEGNLSTNEFATLVCLIMLADKDSGKGEINAPLLRYYLPDLSSDAAQRALSRLEAKGYIFRHRPGSSKRAYPYWVNNYEVTTGQYKGRRVCIDEVTRSKDVNDVLYVDSLTQGAALPATDGATQAANSNNNRKDRKEKGEVAVVIDRDSLGSIPAGANRLEPLSASVASTILRQCGNQPDASGTGVTGHSMNARMIALAAMVKGKVNVTQSIAFTEREAPGIAALGGTTLEDMSNALDWALQEPFWSQRIVGPGALKSLLRNLTTIQRQMAAQKKAAAKTNQPLLKAASVAADPGQPFNYEGEIL
jgi:hypothetical protein